MTEFTPLTSLAGGMLIGLSAVLFMFLRGASPGSAASPFACCRHGAAGHMLARRRLSAG